MGRMIWVALGAAGGVYAYRRGSRLLEEARQRGLVGSVQAATGSAAGLATTARTLIQASGGGPRPADDATGSRKRGPAASSTATGSAAARVMAQARVKPPAQETR